MIEQFRGEFRFLSNFWPAIVFYEGAPYPSVEHAYQASKTQDLELRKSLRGTPGQVKRLMSQYPRRQDARVIMLGLVQDKFNRHAELAQKLIATRPHTLVERNYWHDNFWGWCYCPRCLKEVGHNYLGQILMDVRDEL